mmetsp:Transcript_35364/g.76281  ORF Transcript_35364/g.76281 Transcript_35364/m.76281 type:complete len:428 (+) Transcript_35364:1391-2674(+)
MEQLLGLVELLEATKVSTGSKHDVFVVCAELADVCVRMDRGLLQLSLSLSLGNHCVQVADAHPHAHVALGDVRALFCRGGPNTHRAAQILRSTAARHSNIHTHSRTYTRTHLRALEDRSLQCADAVFGTGLRLTVALRIVGVLIWRFQRHPYVCREGSPVFAVRRAVPNGHRRGLSVPGLDHVHHQADDVTLASVRETLLECGGVMLRHGCGLQRCVGTRPRGAVQARLHRMQGGLVSCLVRQSHQAQHAAAPPVHALQQCCLRKRQPHLPAEDFRPLLRGFSTAPRPRTCAHPGPVPCTRLAQADDAPARQQLKRHIAQGSPSTSNHRGQTSGEVFYLLEDLQCRLVALAHQLWEGVENLKCQAFAAHNVAYLEAHLKLAQVVSEPVNVDIISRRMQRWVNDGKTARKLVRSLATLRHCEAHDDLQ